MMPRVLDRALGPVWLTLSGSANPATAGNYAYTGSYLLAANTTYYIVAGVSSGTGAYEWASHDSEDAATIGYSDSFDGGATWNSDNTPPGTVFTDATFNMQVNAGHHARSRARRMEPGCAVGFAVLHRGTAPPEPDNTSKIKLSSLCRAVNRLLYRPNE